MTLPVSAEHVSNKPFIVGLPYLNVPQIEGCENKTLNAIVGYLIKELQDKAHVHAVHTFIYNLCLENDFNNPLVKTMVNNINLEVTKSKEKDLELNIREKVVTECNKQMRVFVKEHPVIETLLSPEEYQTLINSSKKDINPEVNNNMDRPCTYLGNKPFWLAFNRENGQPLLDRQGQQLVMDDQGWLFEGVNLYQPVMHYNEYMQQLYQYQQQAPAQPYHYRQQQNQNQNNFHYQGGSPSYGQNTGSYYQRDNSISTVSQHTGYSSTYNEPVHSPSHYQGERHLTSEVASSGAETTTRTFSRNNNQPVQREVKQDQKVIANVERLEVCEDKEKAIEREHTPNQPYPLAYDPFSHQLFYVKTLTGHSHDLVNRTQEVTVDYLKHELRPELRTGYKDASLRKGPPPAANHNHLWETANSNINESELAEMVSTLDESSSPAEIEGNIYITDKDERVFTASSIDEGISKAAKVLKQMNVVERSIFNFGLSIPVEFEITKKDAAFIERLNDAKTLAIFAREMCAYRDNNPDRLMVFWKVINDQMTKTINDVIRIGLGVKASIRSFADSGDTLIADLKKGPGESIARLLENIQVRLLADRWVKCNAVSVISEEEGQYKLEISEDWTVLVLSCLSDEFRINTGVDNFGIIIPSKMPEIYQLLQKMIAGTNFFDRRVIVSADGVKIYVHRGLLEESAILVSLF
jgi:hypothetical protein